MDKTGIGLVMQAANFAAIYHCGTPRKGVKQEPYVNHVIDVANILAEATGGEDSELIAAALLHDTVEDCGVTRAQLVEKFGEEVAEVVLEVTDDKSLPKAERKRLQVLHAPHRSDRARMLKIADKTSNLKSIICSRPADWDLKRIMEYRDHASAVVAGCRNVNPSLDSVFDKTLEEFNALYGSLETL